MRNFKRQKGNKTAKVIGKELSRHLMRGKVREKYKVGGGKEVKRKQEQKGGHEKGRNGGMRVTKETKNEKRPHLEPELSEKERSERENRNVGAEEIGKRGR